jgi:ribonuclease R
MLPFELSTNICSLNPQVDRLVLSALLEIDHRGEVVGQEFVRGVIRSVERMTYTNVHLLLEGDAGLRERYRPLVERFTLMQELALILNRKRVRRGSIDFDLPEPLIEFDEFGEMTGVTRAPRNVAHRLIEEFMLAANEAVAAHLAAAGPSIFRIHELPDPKRVMDFEEVAAHFGYSLGVGAIPVKKFSYADKRRDGRKQRKDVVLPLQQTGITSRNYQKLVAKIEGKPEERILSYLMLRSLKQARYSEENLGHFALAATSYTHFTSPIRRYPDLIDHRLLKSRLAGQGKPAGGFKPPSVEPPADRAALQKMAADASFAERQAMEVEREVVDLYRAFFLRDRIGDVFDGTISGVMGFGFFVVIDEPFVEGLVRLEALSDDYYVFDEAASRLVGRRSGRTFALGDTVKVEVQTVSVVRRKIDFALHEHRAHVHAGADGRGARHGKRERRRGGDAAVAERAAHRGGDHAGARGKGKTREEKRDRDRGRERIKLKVAHAKGKGKVKGKKRR